MKADPAAPWREKRALAYLYALLAERQVEVRFQDSRDGLGVELLIDLLKKGRPSNRLLAIRLRTCDKIPSRAALSTALMREMNAQDPQTAELPFAIFLVQVREIKAVYSWFVEPKVIADSAVLVPQQEYKWHSLNDSAIAEILERVEEFWDTLLRKAVQAADSH
jgi:hypothetical protein